MPKSDKPLVRGADPTSPYGMTIQALAKELIEVHGVSRHIALGMNHKARAEVVIEARRERDAEDTARANVERGWTTEAEAQGAKPMFGDDIDIPALVAEQTAAFEVEGVGPDPRIMDTDEAIAMRNSALFDMAQPVEEEDIDPDDLMAELLATKDEQEQYQLQHGLLIKDPHTLDYVFNGHAGAGPSASERWMHCTASLGASRAFLETLTPNQQEQFAVANIAARQGTTAHAAAETEARVILGEVSQEEANLTMLELAIEPETDGEAYDEEMAEYIIEYVDLVRTYAQDRGDDQVLIEQRVVAAVPLTDLHEGEVYEIPGSGDCVVLPSPEDPTLVVADLKYGNGVWVDVDENPQVRIYALGALGLLVDEEGALRVEVENVTYHIAQPRMDGIKTWTEPLSDLLQWRDEVLAPTLTKALYGQGEGATYAPSETACQFCPARGSCPALAEDRLTRAADLFDVVVEAEFTEGPGSFPETTSLTDTRLGELLVQITGLIDIHKDLKAEAERRLYRGDAVPGFQLVNYTPPRKWKEGAEQQFDDVPELWTKKMVTPTQALKIAKANAEEWDEDELLPYIDVPDKRPVVAREGDRRKPWTGRPPEAMFDDESGEQA